MAKRRRQRIDTLIDFHVWEARQAKKAARNPTEKQYENRDMQDMGIRSKIYLQMSRPFQFDKEKAIEALLYVAPRVRGGDMYTTLKLLYLADKCHLHRYGRFIFGDRHWRLQYGPVPSGAYDLVKEARGENFGRDAQAIRALLNVQGNSLHPTREADRDVFSKSDLECLDEAIRESGTLSFSQMRALTHDAAFNATVEGQEISPFAIAALADNPASLLQHLSNAHPDRE
jgi:uncharacterized phage-associated protein